MSRPNRVQTERLDEVLADAEKMARRVDGIIDEDPFAASLLAREYLSRVQEIDVNPLNQQGRTDAWTSAFVRLRVAADRLAKHEHAADGEAYLTARAEERRLFALLGVHPKAQLTEVRHLARRQKLQARAFRSGMFAGFAVAIVAGLIALVLHRPWVGFACAVTGVVAAGVLFTLSQVGKRSFATSSRRAAELERGISRFAAFETSDLGRGVIQRIQREHPVLARTSLGDASSAPPAPRSSGFRSVK